MASLQSLLARLPLQAALSREALVEVPRALPASPRGWRTLRPQAPEGDCTLAQLHPGARATIAKVFATGPVGAHLLEMGLTPGTPICLRHRGRHHRVEISVRAYVFSLPVEEASLIRVTTTP